MRLILVFAGLFTTCAVNAASFTWLDTHTNLYGKAKGISETENYYAPVIDEIASEVDFFRGFARGSGKGVVTATSAGVHFDYEASSFAEYFYDPQFDRDFNGFGEGRAGTGNAGYRFSLDESATIYVDGLLEFRRTEQVSGSDWGAELMIFEVGNSAALLQYNWGSQFNPAYGEFSEVIRDQLTLGAGEYMIRTVVTSESAATFGGGSAYSQIDLNVTLVPVPAAAVLFPSALLLLGWLRRRSLR